MNWIERYIAQVKSYLPVYLRFLYQPYWPTLRHGVIMLANLSVVAGGVIVLFIIPETATAIPDVTLAEWETNISPLGTLILSFWTIIHFKSFSYQGFKVWKARLAD